MILQRLFSSKKSEKLTAGAAGMAFFKSLSINKLCLEQARWQVVKLESV
jgi:hypothetical protein